MILLKKVVQTCDGCPYQWDAWDINDQYYYLRYRHALGTVEMQPSPDTATWTVGRLMADDHANMLRCWRDGQDQAMTLAEFLRRAGDMYLTEDAMVTQITEEDDMSDEDPPQTPPPDPTEPTPVSQGTYALFETPDGGRLLVAHPQGDTEPMRFPIPPAMMAIGRQVAEGKPIGGLLGRFFPRPRTGGKS